MKRLSQFIFKQAPKPVQSAIPKSISQNISNCQVHEEKDYPNVKALEMCLSCEAGMCYICGNEHFDQNHTVDWGFDIFNVMEAPRDEKNEAFNSGYRTLLDFNKTKCPCGNSIPGKKTAAVCACCGTVTCSAECHDKYVQSVGKCLFIRNFIQNEQTIYIQVREIPTTKLIQTWLLLSMLDLLLLCLGHEKHSLD